jgi:restriction system protein
MKNMTIKDAAIEVLKSENTPLSISEIHSKIVEQKLFEFKTKDPQSIVQTAIRRHCDGVDFKTANSKKYFQILVGGKYWIKGVAIPQS